jgi:thymidine phosphorylase
VNAQNKSDDFDKRVAGLELAKYQKIIYTKKEGKIVKIDNGKINSLCRVLGTPETISAGVYLHSHLGKIKEGQKILTLYSESKQRLQEALKFIQEFDPIKIE